jgi:hypothetical protein
MMVTSHYVIDQSMISNSEMKKTFGGEAKQNPPDSTYSPMYINLFDIFQQMYGVSLCLLCCKFCLLYSRIRTSGYLIIHWSEVSRNPLDFT